MTLVTTKNVRKGMFLIDEFSQVCRVESVGRHKGSVFEVRTRRFENGYFWTGAPCVWNPDSFGYRKFRKHRKRRSSSLPG